MNNDILNNSIELSYEAFFRGLGYGDKDTVFFRTFSDKRGGEAQNHQVPFSYLKSILPTLRRLNSEEERRGVFYVVNGSGNNDAEVKRGKIARAQFMEMDEGSFPEQLAKLSAFPLEPSFIIKTQKSLHAYWILRNGDINSFRPIQQRLIQQFKGDPTIINESRVLRLYGFNHWKTGEPVPVQLIKWDPELTYTQAELSEVLPALTARATVPKAAGADPAGERIPQGQGYHEVIRLIGYYLNKLPEAPDSVILSAVEADFFPRYDGQIREPSIEAWRDRYIKDVAKIRAKHEAEDRDPAFWGYAVRAWEEERQRTFQKGRDSWEEVRAAGEKAQAAGKTFDRKKTNTSAPTTKTKTTPKSKPGQTLPSYDPHDHTDVGQAEMYVEVFGEDVAFSPATKFIVYDGTAWKESDLKAQLLSQELTTRQLKEAEEKVMAAQKQKLAAEASGDQDEAKRAQNLLNTAKKYFSYAIDRRKSSKISATLAEVKPMVEIDVDELDKDPFLLNTPAGAVDLRTGDIRPHDRKDYCTKITAVSPDTKNADIFTGFIDQVTGGDKNLARYIQEVAGMCAVGKVLKECLIIAYGEGGNGKSTLFNLLGAVMGDYSGRLSAEVLTQSAQKNKSPEYAELRGKRIVVAAELEEGERLSTSIVKKLCSTDPIQAEKKYKDPFFFIPSHSVILYTNHLPKVRASDTGTWSRLVVIPFKTKFRNVSGEIKNYADHLFQQCGGAVLSWIIEGAKRFIANGGDIVPAKCVEEAINQYKKENDWLSRFIDECCEVEPNYTQRGGEFYDAFRNYCTHTGEFPRSKSDFNKALESAGYHSHKSKFGVLIYGLRLIEEAENPFDSIHSAG